MTETWRDSVPRSVTDPFDSQGQPVFTPTDRRWLWHLEGWLAVAATNEGQHEKARDLKRYLTETCEHHFILLTADDGEPPSRMCTWCNWLEWETADGWAA